MPTNFPSSLDSFTNPSGASSLNTPGVLHHTQHDNANDAITALEVKVGIDGSTDVNSLDYKINHVVAGNSNAIVSTAYNCLSSVALYDIVYCNGADSIAVANATSLSTAPAIGFVNSKPTTTTAILTYFGELGGFSGLTSGVQYFLNTVDGQITTTAPSTTGNILQRVGIARNSTTLLVQIDSNFILL
jgi:hypothetical protein